MLGKKLEVLNLVNREARLTHLDKVVLSSIIHGAAFQGGKWIFSQSMIAWSFSIDVRPRGIERILKRLIEFGYVKRLTAERKRNPQYQVLFGLDGEEG